MKHQCNESVTFLGVDKALAAEVLIAEYEVLRKEIDVYHTHQERAVTYSLITLGAFGGFVEWVAANNGFNFFLLGFPLLFALYAFLFADKMVRIIRIADYIHNGIRPSLSNLVEYPVLQWEVYKSHHSLFRSKFFPAALDIGRWALFIVPGVLSLVVFKSFKGDSILTLAESVLVVIDVITLFILIFYIHAVNETSGVTARNILDMDKKSLIIEDGK